MLGLQQVRLWVWSRVVGPLQRPFQYIFSINMINASTLKHVGIITDPVGLAESSVPPANLIRGDGFYTGNGIFLPATEGINAFGTGSREMMDLDGKS